MTQVTTNPRVRPEMLNGMDRDRLIEKVSEYNDADDHAGTSRLIAQWLLTHDPAESPEERADLLRELAEAQLRLGAEARALALLDAAARLHPQGWTMTLYLNTLRARGEDQRVHDHLASWRAPAPGGTWPDLFEFYRDLRLPALAHQAAQHARKGVWKVFVPPQRGLWWRTGGPLWFVRAAMRRREQDRLVRKLGTGRAAEPADLDEVARAVLAAADRDGVAFDQAARAQRLRGEGKPVEAARVLTGADWHPLVLLEAVGAARDCEDLELALRLCARLAEHDAQYSGLVDQTARALLTRGHLRQAWDVLDTRGGHAGTFRRLRMEILLAAGLPHLAVGARGRPSRADHDRAEWRNWWWRTGGPVPFLRARGIRREEIEFDSWEPAADATTALTDLTAAFVRAAEVDVIVSKALDLRIQDNHPEAVALLAASIDPGRPSALLLTELASTLCYYADDDENALLQAREARAMDPASPSALVLEMEILGYLERRHEALVVLEALPEHMTTLPEIRDARSDQFLGLGLTTLAHEAYGPAAGLPSWIRNGHRRRLWWRTGGPLRAVRRNRLESERLLLQTWQRIGRNQARILATVVGAEQAVRLRAVAESFHARENVQRLRWSRAHVVTRLVIGAAGSVAAGLALAWLAGESLHLGVVWQAAVGLVGARLCYLAQNTANRFPKAMPGIAAVAVAGYLVTRLTVGWPDFIGALAVVAAGIVLVQRGVGALVGVAAALTQRRFRRREPRGAALSEMLDLLDDISRPARRADLAWRRRRLQTLEQVALIIESDLPATFAAPDAHTAEQLRRRARGAAAAVRELKYQLVTGPAGGWRRIEGVLKADIAALATGSLARLRYAEPASARVQTRSRRQLVAYMVRILLFAGLPLGVVLVSQPWLRFSETILNWARLLGVGWALVYVLGTVDPTFADRLRTWFALVNLGRGNGDPAQLDRAERPGGGEQAARRGER
ncbi:hypothetical protein [Winogradskya humida]|uniref:hypothetical protein n=1 Tax=Winogradskya humida TaxID=113566 RepID=UPI001943C081|nr:hypothetical protein [Actinoplanes humidus]